MKHKFYIRGSKKHGTALIEALEAMGGINSCNLKGTSECSIYIIDEKNNIGSIPDCDPQYDDWLKSGTEIRVTKISDKTDADVGKELAEALAQWTWVDLFLSTILLISDNLKSRERAPKKPQEPKCRKTEYAVGEEFDFGLVRLKVAKGIGCQACVFKRICEQNRKDAILSYVGPCCNTFRSDDCSVVFCKAKE